MDIRKRRADRSVVLELEGDLTLEASDDVRHFIDACIHEGHQRIVLDFAQVSRLDSAGLGELVRAFSTASRRGCSLTIANPPQEIQRLQHVTGTLEGFLNRPRPSGAAHPRDIIWMVWVAIAATVAVALFALFWT